MAVRKTELAKAQREFWQEGVVPALHEVELFTTDLQADDFVLLYYFGNERCWLSDLRIQADDLDASGAPTLAFSVGLSDSDGTLDTTLIATSTIGQAGGSTSWTAGSFPVEATGKYLTIDVTTAAATAQAGGVRFYVQFANGLRQLLDDGTRSLRERDPDAP